ncbi:MAG: hypothetical protein AAGG01_16095, partial [Planctomycetota bacterium]
YAYDDGSTENAIGLDMVAEIGFLQGFQTPAGADVISEIRVAVGTALASPGGLDGNALRVGIWDDPNDDGNPSDAVLLYVSSTMGATLTNTDQKVAYPVSPGVPVNGSFFIGALTEHGAGEFPVGLDQTNVAPGTPTFIVSDAASIDPANLAGTTGGVQSISGAYFLVEASGGGSSSPGVVYCTPAPINSTGAPAQISAVGSSAVTDNDLTLVASQLPAFSFGFFIVSQTQGFVPNPGGSEGNLCVTGSVGRFIQQIQSSGAVGEIMASVDLTALPQPTGSVVVGSGETWNFQAWYRDSSPAGPTSNLTDGLQVDFQ